ARRRTAPSADPARPRTDPVVAAFTRRYRRVRRDTVPGPTRRGGVAMRGLMQDRPLALPHVFHRAEQLFGHKPMVTATADGEVTTTIAEWALRVRRLATALDGLGVP